MGADPNRIMKWGWRGGNGGHSLLTNRIYYGSPASVVFLLENGADPNKRNGFGATPAREGAVRGDLEIISLLHEAGSNFRTLSYDETPRQIAASFEHPLAVDLIDKILLTEEQ